MFEVAALYTLIIAVEIGVILVKSLDVFHYFHDRFDPKNIGGLGYLGPKTGGGFCGVPL